MRLGWDDLQLEGIDVEDVEGQRLRVEEGEMVEGYLLANKSPERREDGVVVVDDGTSLPCVLHLRKYPARWTAGVGAYRSLLVQYVAGRGSKRLITRRLQRFTYDFRFWSEAWECDVIAVVACFSLLKFSSTTTTPSPSSWPSTSRPPS